MSALITYKKGGIHIKPENKGKFTQTKKATGKSTEELTHSKNPVTKKRAIFAQNAKKWKHQKGGNIIDKDSLYNANLYTQGISEGLPWKVKAAQRNADGDIIQGAYNIPNYKKGLIGAKANAKNVMRLSNNRVVELAKDMGATNDLIGNISEIDYNRINNVRKLFYPQYYIPIHKQGGGLSRAEDYKSKKKPYPTVENKDFAGTNRSYPIPSKADQVDALKLASLHGRGDVKSKVFKKYPELKKKEKGGLITYKQK